MAEPDHATRSSRLLLGRDRELAVLATTLDEARHGPAAALIVGEAGIGKTALLGAVADVATQRAYRVLRAAGGEVERTLPYAAIGDLLERVADEFLGDLPVRQRHALEAALVRGPHGGRAEPRPIAAAVLAALRGLAERQPLLLLLDDVHWLDASSARALAFSVRRFDRETIALVAASRVAAPEGFDLAALLPLSPVRHLRLAALPPPDILTLTEPYLGARMPAPARDIVVGMAGGNPLLAIEMSRALSIDPDWITKLELGARLPERLDRLMGTRLEALPLRVTHALAVVAALAQPTVPLIEAAGVDLAVVQEAVAAGIVRFAADRAEFTHPLLRTASLAQLDAPARRALHGRLAALTDDPVARARHLAVAAERSDVAVAGVVEAGARAASRRGAPFEGALLAEEALRLTPASATAARYRRLRLAGDLRGTAGDARQAQRLLAEAVQLAPPARRAEALFRLAEAEGDVTGAPAYDRCLEALRATRDPRLQAEIHMELATSQRVTIPMELARRHARHAVAAARRSGNPQLLSNARSVRSMLEFTSTGFVAREVREQVGRLKQALREPGNRGRRRSMWVESAVHQLVWSNDVITAGQVLDAIPRSGAVATSLLWYRGVHQWLTGRWREAGVTMAQQVRVAEQSGMAPDEAAALAFQAVIAAHSGDPETDALARRAQLVAAEAGAHRFVAVAHWALGELALGSGDAVTAEQQFGSAMDFERRLGLVLPSGISVVPGYGESLVLLGRLADARAHLSEFEPVAQAWRHPLPQSGLARVRAMLEAADGDPGAGVATLAPWLIPAALPYWPFHRARALLAHGALLRRSHRLGEARRSLTEARTTFAMLGARLWTARADGELRRTGVPAIGPEQLTETESRIAQLAASGRSNREIGETLFLSPRTVEWNLTRIYAKLQVRSRTALAARFTSQTAATPPD
jgi:DNA-binding CsgD family transcriptional regulator